MSHLSLLSSHHTCLLDLFRISFVVPLVCLFVCLFVYWLSETGFLCVALAVLELCRPGWPRTQKSACLCLSSAGIKDVRHHARLAILIKSYQEAEGRNGYKRSIITSPASVRVTSVSVAIVLVP